jgi:ABC-2 type transport system ATP-binding protein
MTILRTSRLTRTYGARKGVDAIDLEVGPGEIFGFLGPNGAGKTTTIRLLMGLLKPDSGRAEIVGRDCWRESPRVKREVGYLPGDLRLYPWLTWNSAVAIVSQVRGIDLRPEAGELADRFELERNLRVRKMSRGTRQKLGLVLAMAHRPRLLILDEPTSGLDPLMQTVLAELLRAAAAAGQAVFFSSHTLSEVESLCDRVAIIRRGALVVDESLEVLRNRAPRTVELVYETEDAAQAAQLPDFLAARQPRGRGWICQLRGPAPPLVEWASRQPLVDLRISRPDLDAVFHAHYHGSESNE